MRARHLSDHLRQGEAKARGIQVKHRVHFEQNFGFDSGRREGVV